MSLRCGLRPFGLRRDHVCLFSRTVQVQPRCIRHNSSSSASSSTSQPERSRKLPGSDEPFRLKPWQRRFIIGMALGLATTQAYFYCDKYINQTSFTTYKLIAKEPVSSTASIFRLAPKESSQEFELYKEAWRRGIWNVHFKQPQLQIVRAYTPLPPVESGSLDTSVSKQASRDLRFLIRHDAHGEVSSYLHRLPVGADIELRGPNLEYNLTPDIRQVVFFAGGTGIAPALQIAHTMFDTETTQEGEVESVRKGRKLHILWASRRREDCQGGVSDAAPEDPRPAKSKWSGMFASKKSDSSAVSGSAQKGLIVQELESLKKRYPGQVTVEYFVNEEDTWIDDEVVYRALSRFDDKDFSQGSPSQSEQRQILISGPNGFITYLAGPKEWKHGREEQGHVSKIIAHAIAQNPHHVKVWKV